MKISNKQKLENREKIIASAIDLITKKGLKSASMREIAKKAGVGEATIYNYFPSKTAIIYGYYYQQLNKTVEKLREMEGFSEFSLQEQLQSVIDKMLELFIADREFVSITFENVFFSLSQNYQRLKPIRTLFIDMVNDIFRAAEEVGEIPAQVFADIIYQLIWDYTIGIVIYWLHDESDEFENTSVLLDKSLNLFCSLLKAGIANKLSDIGLFFFKNHILSRMEFFTDKIKLFNKVKRAFMEGHND